MTTTLSERVRELDAAATSAPWHRAWCDKGGSGHVDSGSLAHGDDAYDEGMDLLGGSSGYGHFKRHEDRDVVATLRNALPALAAYIEAAEALYDTDCDGRDQARFDAAEAELLAALQGGK
jgi:hypothetical protein